MTRLADCLTLCHRYLMKTVSIRELHESTVRIVRSAAEEATVVTDQGRPIAIIRPAGAGDLPGRPLPANHWLSRARPAIEADSAEAVSADRDRDGSE